MENPEYGKVVGLTEQRPVCKSATGDLIAGDTHQFLDLLLCNHKGEEKLVRVPVGSDVVAFFATE